MPKRATIVFASLAAVVVVGAAGLLTALRDETRTDSARADHPCRRVSVADLETVLPAPVTVEQDQVVNGGQVCRWSYPLPAGRGGPATALWPNSTVEVGVWHGRWFYVPDAVAEEFTPVPEIPADAAHADWPEFLTFRKGETVVVIENWEGFDLDRQAGDELPRWRALATLVASRY